MQDLSVHEPFRTYNVKGREELDLEKALIVTLLYLGRQCPYYEMSKISKVEEEKGRRIFQVV